ncbi:MAG: hypothetical protein LBJ95_01855 [Oscillospiraceae bacterium]|nr:hypothetical protein [Oscillospiraceae bacterium]
MYDSMPDLLGVWHWNVNNFNAVEVKNCCGSVVNNSGNRACSFSMSVENSKL